MSLSIGIVGLPNAGKSTLFNALVRSHQAKVENYPFTTIEPNVGIVEVPDDRLQKLQSIVISNSQFPISKQNSNPNNQIFKTIPATIKFIDIAGLVKNAHKGEGLGNQFLGHIREVDAIIHVIDSFSKDSGPQETKEIINLELELADIKKPTIYVYNVAEKDLEKSENKEQEAIYLCAKLEADLIDLNEKEQKEYLQVVGLKVSGLNDLILAAYRLLNLITFYTLLPNQAQAWPIKKGATADEAAGKIHQDFQKGFIKAEVIAYEDFIRYNGEDGAKKAGKLRYEGKDYIIKDGDVVYFRFNI